eukprot:6179042-Pleurochrysis_carterae.AAC.2
MSAAMPLTYNKTIIEDLPVPRVLSLLTPPFRGTDHPASQLATQRGRLSRPPDGYARPRLSVRQARRRATTWPMLISRKRHDILMKSRDVILHEFTYCAHTDSKS